MTCDPSSVVAGQFSQCTASATDQDGKPFAGSSMTEDYEVGLRIGALGLTL